MKEETTYGVSPKRLVRLLAIGLEKNDGENNLGDMRTPADELRDMLGAKLPLDPAKSDSLPAILKRPCDEMLSAYGQTIGYLLLSPKTDLNVIRTLKDYFKELVSRRPPNAKQAAAIVVYYAAIASALVFHRQKISRHSYDKLHQAYTELEQKPWVPSELKCLFEKAGAIFVGSARKSLDSSATSSPLESFRPHSPKPFHSSAR
ncbi:MAG: hypothetical protein Q8Q12_11105 [bacterium]|nr:hypothetical protein [bacterium]